MSNIHATTDSEYEYRWGVGCTWGVEWADSEDHARLWYAEDQEVGYDSLLVKQFLGPIEAVR